VEHLPQMPPKIFLQIDNVNESQRITDSSNALIESVKWEAAVNIPDKLKCTKFVTRYCLFIGSVSNIVIPKEMVMTSFKLM